MSEVATLVLADRVLTVLPVETTASDDWRAAIALHGEFDVANAPELRAELARHLAAGRRVIRVDTTDVEFIDSTALSALVEASESCRAGRGSLILTNLPPRMQRLVELSGLDHDLLIDTAGDLGDRKPA